MRMNGSAAAADPCFFVDRGIYGASVKTVPGFTDLCNFSNDFMGSTKLCWEVLALKPTER